MTDRETELDQLFTAYRNACETPEAGVSFMPQLWARIEARTSFSCVFTRYARMGSLAAGVFCVVLFLLAHATGLNGTNTLSTYADALAADQTAEKSSYAETIVATSSQAAPLSTARRQQ